MATPISMQGRDIYVRTTDENGRAMHTHHRVWNVGLFMAAREREAATLNEKKGSKKASVTQITDDQYRARA